MGEYRLVRLDGGETLEVRPGSTFLVGRSMTSDLPVRDETISRRHAELTVEDQTLVIRDLGSSNGTRINGVEPMTLKGKGVPIQMFRVTGWDGSR